MANLWARLHIEQSETHGMPYRTKHNHNSGRSHGWKWLRWRQFPLRCLLTRHQKQQMLNLDWARKPQVQVPGRSIDDKARPCHILHVAKRVAQLQLWNKRFPKYEQNGGESLNSRLWKKPLCSDSLRKKSSVYAKTRKLSTHWIKWSHRCKKVLRILKHRIFYRASYIPSK